MTEGDLHVFDVDPLDDDGDSMDLCVTATSSDDAVVEVRRVSNQCRSFIAAGKSAGSATLTFRARDGELILPVTVTALPAP